MLSSGRAAHAATESRSIRRRLAWSVVAEMLVLMVATAGCGGDKAPPASIGETAGPGVSGATVGPSFSRATIDPSTPTVVASADGTWAARVVPNSQRVGFRHIVCSGESHCIATGSLTGDQGHIVGPAVLVSGDGGATWATSMLPPDKELEDIRAVACVDELHCVGVADHRGSPAGMVLITGDGGATWEESDAPGGIAFTAVACAGVRCMVAGVREGLGDESSELDTFVSADGGVTWSQAASPKVNAHEVFSLACPTTDRCYLTTSTNDPNRSGGYDFQLFVTYDGGSSWKNRTPSRQLMVAFLACLDGDHCLATGLPHLLRTSDGGEHWTRSFKGSLTDPILAVSCSPGGPCVGVGQKLKVVRSDDGGQNWTQEPAPDQPDTEFVDVSCELPSGCVAVAQRKQFGGTGSNRTYRFDGVILTRTGR